MRGRVLALQAIGLKCVDKRNEMCVAAAVETLADASKAGLSKVAFVSEPAR